MEGNPIDFLMGLTKEVTGALRELENDLPESVSRVERQVKIITTWLVRLEGEKDLPSDLQSVLTEVKASIENVRNAIVDYGSKHSKAPSWTKYMGASKQLIMAFAPAAAVSVAMLPFGAFIIIGFFVVLILFFVKNPHLLRQLQDAWNADMSLQQFREIEQDLKENAKQLRHFVNLKLQIKKERKFDIAKVLQDDRVMQWWCLQFGSQTSSVATDRFIQALVQDQPTYEKSRKEAQNAITSVIRDIIGISDANGDGEISPQEFLSFLGFFGPLDTSVDKIVKSILDFGTSPPSRYPWFFWKKLDRRLVEESCPKQGVGTFLIRCSSNPGEFALSYVRPDKKVAHIKILNTPEGFHFSSNEKKFQDLAQLVIANRQLLVHEYVDPLQRVVFNVGGRKFESTVGVFTPHPDTLLAKLVGTGLRAEAEEVFLDRDPDAFAVILNWYRNGALLPSPVQSRALLAAELRYFGIPDELTDDDHRPAPEAAVQPASLLAHLSHFQSSAIRDSGSNTPVLQNSSSGYSNPSPAAAAEPVIVAPKPTVYSERSALLASNETNVSLSSSSADVTKEPKSEPAATSAAVAPAAAAAAAPVAQEELKDEGDEKKDSSHNKHHPALHVLPKQQSEAVINPGAPPAARLTEDKSYFHGMLSDPESAALLQGKPTGSYLARNSKSNPTTCLIISYVDPKGKMVHFRLWKVGPARFSLNQQAPAGVQGWESLQGFVDAFPEQLKLPVERSSQTAYEVNDM